MRRCSGTSLANARSELERLEREYGLEVDPDAIIEELPVGLQQRVEILKALYRGAEVLILDEPTGVLTPAEADDLFRVLRLRDQGKTIILITHKLREIMAITDTVSVMRQGAMVATRETAKTTVEQLAELMVGRRVLLRVEKGAAKPGAVNLVGREPGGQGSTRRHPGQGRELRRARRRDRRHRGRRRQRPVRTARGGRRHAHEPCRARVMLDGAPLDVTGHADPGELRDRGLAHVPEDRQPCGLVLAFEENENSILGYHDKPQY